MTTVRLESATGVHGSLQPGSAHSGTVVCVHGALDGAASFARVRRRLAPSTVVAYDRRGYRASRGVAPSAALGDHVDDLLALWTAASDAGARGPLVVLGHSFGGLVALGAAASSAQVAGVVAYEPPFPWLRTPTGDAHAPPDADPRVAAETFFRRIVGDGPWDRLSPDERAARQLDGPALLCDLALLGGPLPFDPGAVAVPVVVGLSADAPPRREASARALVSALGDASVVDFARAGHGAHLSSPGQLARVTIELLGRVGPEGGAAL